LHLDEILICKIDAGPHEARDAGPHEARDAGPHEARDGILCGP